MARETLCRRAQQGPRGTLEGPGTRPPFGASTRKPNRALHSQGAMPLPCVPLPCLGPAAEKQEILQGAGKCCLRQGACHLPLVPGFPGGWHCGPRRGHGVPGSPWPPRPQGAHRPTWLLQGGQGCRSWARGPGPVASSACAGTWRLRRPRLQPPLGSPGAARRASQPPGPACVPSGALWRCAAARAGGPAPALGANALGAPDPPRWPPQTFPGVRHTPWCRRPR